MSVHNPLPEGTERLPGRNDLLCGLGRSWHYLLGRTVAPHDRGPFALAMVTAVDRPAEALIDKAQRDLPTSRDPALRCAPN